jgi:hypothetical protein
MGLSCVFVVHTIISVLQQRIPVLQKWPLKREEALMTGGLVKRLVIVALLLAAGGCEFLKKHVRISTDEHSPFSEEKANPDAADSRQAN